MNSIDWQYLFTKFEGRINRQLFWIGVGILLGANILNGILFGDGLVAFAVAIVILFCGLAVYIKRCHDRDKSGWWCLLLLIPVVGLVWAIIDLGILKGTEGPNQYGPDPLQTAHTTAPPPPPPPQPTQGA